MLTRLIATAAALLLACASPQAQAHVRAERVSVSFADLARATALESALPDKSITKPKTALPARATLENPASGKNASLSDWHVCKNWSPAPDCASGFLDYGYGNPGSYIDPDGRIGFLSDLRDKFNETDQILRGWASESTGLTYVALSGARTVMNFGSLPSRATNLASDVVAANLDAPPYAGVQGDAKQNLAPIVHAVENPADTVFASYDRAVETTSQLYAGDRGAGSDIMSLGFDVLTGSAITRQMTRSGDASAKIIVEGSDGSPQTKPPGSSQHDPEEAGDASATSARRAELNAKFGRSGSIDSDINNRGVVDTIQRNATESVIKTRDDLAAGAISTGPQAFGTRAHRYFEILNKRIQTQMAGLFRVKPEQFRDSTGAVVPRRSSGSIGSDVLVEPWNAPVALWNFDLKTHGGIEIPISPARQLEFQLRFGAQAEEIYRPR